MTASSSDAPDLTIVVACYNEERLLEHSMSEVFAVLDMLRLRSEVIFVDDASADTTPIVIDRIIAGHPHRQLRKIEHRTNVGRGGTVADGIRAARGRLVGFLDIDLEVHARYIPGCVAVLLGGAQVVTAKRVYNFSWRSLDRYILSKGYAWLLRRMIALPLADTETGFKFFDRAAILPILEETHDKGWFWDTEIMVRAHWAGLRIVELPALFIRRFDKRSSLRPVRDSLVYLQSLWRFRRDTAGRRRAV
jgi:glycosyltransferase involved in cell wall biosynthesis